MRWLTESAMHRRRSMISADWKKKRGDSIGAAPSDIRLTNAGKRVKATASNLSATIEPGARPSTRPDGSLANQRDRHRMEAHAVACDAAGGAGDVGQPPIVQVC